MTLPDIDNLNTFGGALNDLSAVIDPTTDRPAAGANPAYANTAAMTATAPRAWAQFTLNGTAAPVLIAHNSVWGSLVGVAPVMTRTGVGVYPVTWPSVVFDAIPPGSPGYNASGHTLNLRYGFANVQSATYYNKSVAITAPNVATLYVFSSGGSAADTAGATVFDVVVF